MGSIELGLEGKVSIVTGAGRGLGRDIALRFASQGSKVAILSRSEHEIEEVAETIKKMGSEVLGLKADVSDPQQVRDVVSRTHQKFGTVDILINNAAINIRKPFLEISDSDWQRILDVNLTGYFLFAREVGKIMVSKCSGKVLNVGSELGVVGDVTGQVAYSASKGGVVQLTRCLAAEWARYRINVNCVAPALMDTPLTAELLREPDKKSAFVQAIPLGRFADTGEVADIILFMSSHHADFITGQVLLVDGGYTIV
jgi:NAD(P)-dependent dehydrogenase (short-subunit alcohol dehydrogenase family)